MRPRNNSVPNDKNSPRPLHLRAVGLSPDTEESSPTVTAAGEGMAADKIVKIARRYGIPVVEQPALAKSLGLLDVGTSIPEKLFRAVAIVFNEVEKRFSRKPH